jgi:hypothetical protein
LSNGHFTGITAQIQEAGMVKKPRGDGSMKKTFLLIYLVLFVVLFLLCAMIWHWQMAGTYFVSQQKGIIVDFFPPFVRPGLAGEIYLKPENAVYTIWAVYAGVAVLAPAVTAWLLVRYHDRALRKSWM